MVLGEAIKSVRLRLGMTQGEVCRRAKITQGFYSSIENGISVPSFDALQRIADAFDLPLVYLVWKATERKDLPKQNRQTYDNIKPAFDNYMEELIN